MRGLPLLLAAGLAVFSLAVYWPALSNEFTHYDDDVYVTGNRRVLGGLTGEGLKWAFATLHAGNWHPLTWISHMLDVEIFGVSPRGHHLTSVALHAANVTLLFLVLLRMTGALWRSAAVAAFFAVHPLRVESVAWVAERKDVLSAFFCLMMIAAYLAYARKPGARRLVTVIVLFALGLAAKPMLVTFPVVLLVLDWWPLGRGGALGGGSRGPGSPGGVGLPRSLLEKTPLLVLAAATAAVTLAAQSYFGAVSTVEKLPILPRVANALVAYVGYIVKTLWPRDLSVFYPFVQPDSLLWLGLIGAAAVTGASGLVLLLARRLPFLAAGWLWYLITLLPVIGLIQVGSQSMADRYTYLPLIGLYMALSWGTAVAASGRSRAKAVVALCTVLLLGTCIALTRRQLAVWRDDASLFGNAVRASPRSWVAWYNLGNMHMSTGSWGQAADAYASAVRLEPYYAAAANNLCAAYLQLGRDREAESMCRSAVGLDPAMADAYYNLGLSLANQGKHREALAGFRKTLLLDPEFAEARRSLEKSLAAMRAE